jgi:hypothetical protein
MTPAAVHFAASTVRNMRAQITAFEKLVNSPDFSKADALDAMRYLRKVCEAYERALGSVDVSLTR